MPNNLSPNGGNVWEHCVSSGTLRTADLLRNFADELERLHPFNGRKLYTEARECADKLDETEDDPDWAICDAWAELRSDADDVLGDLFDVLNEACPDGMFFGATDGDGACFGFWHCERDEDAGE